MNRWTKLLVAGMLLVSAASASYISKVVEPFLAYPDGLAGGEHGIARRFTGLSLFGQMRIALGKYFWLRTEDYLHFGIMHNSYTHQKVQEEMIDGYKASMKLSPDSERAKVARPKERDWRGLFKNFSFVQPIKGYHGSPSELLPWYRAQTIINPTDTDAYVNAAFFLADFEDKGEEAFSFLQEGAENNPDSVEIQAAIGRLYIEKWKRYNMAIPHLEKAVALAGNVKDRDKGERRDVGNAYVFLALSYKNIGDLDSALRTAKKGVAELPDYALIRSMHRIVMKDIEQQ